MEQSNTLEPVAPAVTPDICLNLGGGDIPVPGYLTVDRKTGGEVFPIRVPMADLDYLGHARLCDDKSISNAGDSNTGSVGIRDNSVACLRASHVLEHFGYVQRMDVLAEWVRVLKPGGKIQIAVPDFALMNQAFNERRVDLPLELYMYGGQTDENDFHKSAYTEGGLTSMMLASGIERIRRWKSDVQDCAALPISLNLEGYKADPSRKVEGLTPAILSTPRLNFTDNTMSILRAFLPLGIDFRQARGAYWDHVISEAVRQAAAENVKYILTLDYDSAFTKGQVRELYRLMEENPHVDALCSMQVRRDLTTALMTIEGKDGKAADKLNLADLECDLMPIRSGHFGLTIFRAARFDDSLPRPWFVATPDADGHWGEGRIDADVNFWFNWTKSGRTLFIAPQVSIGHLQLVVTWLDRHMQPLHQPVAEWSRGEVPLAARRLCE